LQSLKALLQVRSVRLYFICVFFVYTGAEKQDKRMDTVDQEIGKLATTLKEVMEMLGEIKKNQDERNPT
jgi:hypothetical protein